MFGKDIPASYFQSINAVAIVIFASLFVAMWGFLSRRGKEPASPYKQAIGLFLLALGYLVIAFGVKGIDPSTKVSMFWLVSLYMIHTFGELCLSPIGLSMVNKLAPVKFASLLMGVWFLSTATANKFAGTLSSYYPETMLTVAAVENQKTVNGFDLTTKMDKAEEINGTKYISIDLVSFESVPKERKNAILKETFSGSIVKEKSFMGYKINDLYSFFMLFVFMAGISSVILFFLSRKLLQMMHGVR
jgi:POT family proton-dependent oligopeptide transporter